MWDRLLARMVYIVGTCCYPGLYIYVGHVVSQDCINMWDRLSARMIKVGKLVSQDGISRWDRFLARMVYLGRTDC